MGDTAPLDPPLNLVAPILSLPKQVLLPPGHETTSWLVQQQHRPQRRQGTDRPRSVVKGTKPLSGQQEARLKALVPTNRRRRNGAKHGATALMEVDKLVDYPLKAGMRTRTPSRHGMDISEHVKIEGSERRMGDRIQCGKLRIVPSDT